MGNTLRRKGGCIRRKGGKEVIEGKVGKKGEEEKEGFKETEGREDKGKEEREEGYMRGRKRGKEGIEVKGREGGGGYHIRKGRRVLKETEGREGGY